MSDIKDLINDRCPNGVDFLNLKVLAEITTGKSDRRNADENGKYPFYVRSKDILRIDKYEYDETAIVIPGEGGVGEIFHFVSGKYALHQRAYRIHVTSKKLNAKFLYYYMFSEFKSFINKKAVIATVTSIRKPMIEEFEIPIPPLKVQNEIVYILDKFTELTAELTARKKQYEYYRNLLLNISPLNVCEYKLSQIAKFSYGYTAKAEDKGDARFIRITDITSDGHLQENDRRYILLNDENKKYILKNGDLVMARTGASFGKTLYFENSEPSIYASFLIKITLDNSIILNKYYWHFSKSNLYWNQANNLVSRGGQQQFNSNVLGNIKINVPPLDIQYKVVNILDHFDAICTDLNIGLPAEIEARQKQYEFYRDQLLTFVQTGHSILTDRQTDRQTDRI